MNDDDYEDHANPTTLSWENYTTYEQIQVNPDLITHFVYLQTNLNEEKLMEKCKDWFLKNNYLVQSDIHSTGMELIEIKKDEEKFNLVYYFDCIVIRSSNSTTHGITDFLKNNDFMKVKSIVKIPHIEELEKLDNLHIQHKTGIFDNDEELLPRTFMIMKKGNMVIGNALLEYFEGEFGLTSSTLLMFEIEEEFQGMEFGRIFLGFIERKMKDYGFDRLYLADTRSMGFWRKMGYEIDIDEGWKEL